MGNLDQARRAQLTHMTCGLQVLQFNTRNLLKTKQKFMNTFKLESHDLQLKTRRLRQNIAQKLTEHAVRASMHVCACMPVERYPVCCLEL